MPPKRKPTQESFDEAVRINIEDFGMEPDEALQSAIEEFEVQGFDLSGIIKGTDAGQLDRHEVRVQTRTLESAVAAEPADEAAAATCLEALKGLCSTSDKQALQENVSVAEQSSSVQVLLQAAHKLGGALEQPALAVLKLLLLESSTAREQFAEHGGVAQLLASVKQHAAAAGSAGQDALAGALAVVAAACKAEEANKDSFMSAGGGDLALEVLQQQQQQQGGSGPGGSVVEAACGCLLSFTTADDRRPPTSKAFLHARLLAQKGAPKVMAQLLDRFSGEPSPLLLGVLAALRQLSANEEICKEVLQLGGVAACLALLQAHGGSAEVAGACCAALRQLANSDAVKTWLAENQGLEALSRVMQVHGRDGNVLEKCLGTLAALLLRQPEIAAQAFQAGLGEAMLEAMADNEGQAAVARQGCISLRNMVVRNPELRQALLDKGAEAVLRRAKTLHPSSCRDVGSAALRDLGLDNYNE